VLTNEEIQTLVSAGLTSHQAKVLLTIVQAGKADAKTISKATGLDRSNVYKTILELQEVGIIAKLVQTPSQYTSIPMEQIISTILKEKRVEYQTIQKKAQKLIQQLAYKEEAFSPQQEEYFMIIPSNLPFCNKWANTVKNIQTGIDVIASERREPKDVPVLESYEPLLKRGIKARWLFDRSEKNNKEFMLRVKQFQSLFKYPNFKVRYSISSLRPFAAVKDNNLAVICLDSTSLFKHSRTLWTNNQSIVAALQQRFDMLWNRAEQYEQKGLQPKPNNIILSRAIGTMNKKEKKAK
jgi:sugar-specific transcriptional regulator TrmB